MLFFLKKKRGSVECNSIIEYFSYIWDTEFNLHCYTHKEGKKEGGDNLIVDQ